MKFLTILLAFAAVIPFSLMAQSNAVQQVRFNALSWSRLIDDVYMRDAQGEKVPLWIPNGSPSKEYTISSTLPVKFLRETGKDAEGNPVEEVVATYSPSGAQGKLLIFVENGNDAAYRILPIDFAPKQPGGNLYRFINLSSFPVYVRFGDDRMKIATRGEESIQVPVGKEGGMNIAMGIQVSDEPGDAKIAYSSVWSVRNGRSALVFVTTDLNQDERIDVKKLYF